MSATAAVALVVSSQRRIDRFTAFLDITGHRDRLSYQTYQGFLAIADGGLTGSGVGAGNGKLGYLPLAHSDFIFAVIADELGFVGSLAVLGGFVLLVWFGIQAALAAPDRFGMLLAGGIAAWFGVQAIVNTGGVVGLLPVTGLTLPFLLGRWVVAVRVDDRRRPAAQRGPGGRRACGAGVSTFAVITGGGTGGSRAAGAGHRRGARGSPATVGDAPLHRRRAGHRDDAAPRDAVPAHVPRRRRRATRRSRRQPRLPPQAGAATSTRAACCGALRPRVVVSVGGYASLPAVLAARRLRTPSWSSSSTGDRAGRAPSPPASPRPRRWRSRTRRCPEPS